MTFITYIGSFKYIITNIFGLGPEKVILAGGNPLPLSLTRLESVRLMLLIPYYEIPIESKLHTHPLPFDPPRRSCIK